MVGLNATTPGGGTEAGTDGVGEGTGAGVGDELNFLGGENGS